MTKTATPTREGAVARARSYVDGGDFEIDLARRVAIRTESQALPASLPELERYVRDEIKPSFETLGFTCKIYDNPVPQKGPLILATRMEDPKLPTVLGYGHGDVIRGQDALWTKGKGPWVTSRDGDKLYGRGTADNKCQHTINMGAMAAVMAERGGTLGFNAKYLIETCEEAGSAGINECIRQNKADFAATVFIASDGPRVKMDRPTIVLGNRGGMTFDMMCDLREGAHHSGNWGGLIADPAAILCHAIASIVGPRGALRIRSWLPGPISNSTRDALKDVEIDAGPDGPAIDTWWGEPHLTAPEKVFAWNSFAVLAMTAGRPEAPVNAIAAKAWARCQLRFVVGTKVEDILPSLRRHLDQNGFTMVQVVECADVGRFPATRTDTDHPWAQFTRRSFETTLPGVKAAVIPSTGGGIPNDAFQDILGLPTIWVPHSYAGCSQHAPDEHVLMPVMREACAIMAGLYWDIGAGPVPT
jgi:acetylornithine deacetylase/succinyl-diaminopimelate desuccinylase-like protein